MKHKGILVVVSGFSGAGKGTLMKKLIQEYDNYALSISMTTRMPREGEENGREYFFVTRDVFEEKIREDGFVEYACYCDNYYGTPKEYLEAQLAACKDVILEIETAAVCHAAHGRRTAKTSGGPGNGDGGRDCQTFAACRRGSKGH